jgi:hypothetical protein
VADFSFSLVFNCFWLTGIFFNFWFFFSSSSSCCDFFFSIEVFLVFIFSGAFTSEAAIKFFLAPKR